jgi:hypothetical protein
MALLEAVPARQRLLAGESLSVSVRTADDVEVSWWRDGKLEVEGPTLARPCVETKDAGTYVVLAVKGDDREAHAVAVLVAAPERSLSIQLNQKWHLSSWIVCLILAVGLFVALAGVPISRALRLAELDDARPDAALIALVLVAAGVSLLVAGVSVGVVGVLTRSRSDVPDTVEAHGVDPAAIAKVVSSLDRPRLVAALVGTALLLFALAAALAWRLAGAPPPAAESSSAIGSISWALSP